MKNTLVLSLFSAVSFLSSAQAFTDSTYTKIPDTSKVCIPIAVSGLPTKIDSTFGIDSVFINITHSFDQDLVIQLQSPDGKIITLAGGVGASGHNFMTTCFAENGDSGLIATGTPPFNGTFIPQKSLNILNNGQDPNGTWKLCISDNYFSDTGSYHNCKLVFSANPPPTPPPAAIICTYCTCPGGVDTCDLLPDLVTSALCIQKYHTELPGKLLFANATPNIGRGPVEVHGLDSCLCDTVPVLCTSACPQGLSRIIIQRIYQRHGSDSLGHYDHVAGKMAFHAGHHHIHIDDWGDYSLRLQTPDPDPTKWPIIGSSTKESFCLMNLSNCTDSLGFCKDSSGNVLLVTDIPNAGFGLYSGCGLDQGIYPGNLDVYGQVLNDPIQLNNICDGTFYLVSIVDPGNNFIESNENNNWAAVPVSLTQQTIPSGTTSYNYSIIGLQVLFTNTSPASATYLWNYGDGSWDTLYSPSHTYAVPGTYTVSLVSLDQCFTLTSQVISITGVNEYAQQELNLHLYQNPVTENSFITYFLSRKSTVKIALTDVLGKEVLILADAKQQQGLQKFFLRDAPLPKGVYFLKLTADGIGSSAVKILITK